MPPGPTGAPANAAHPPSAHPLPPVNEAAACWPIIGRFLKRSIREAMHAPGANLILNTDSYKASHWLQYPPRTTATFFYLESRGGAQVPQFSRALRRATTIGGAE